MQVIRCDRCGKIITKEKAYRFNVIRISDYTIENMASNMMHEKEFCLSCVRDIADCIGREGCMNGEL